MKNEKIILKDNFKSSNKNNVKLSCVLVYF